MEFYYNHEIASDVVKRLKENEEALEMLENVIDLIDDISLNNKTGELLDSIDFKELKKNIKLFKENNVIELYEQIMNNSNAVEDSDILMSKGVGEL